MQEIIERLRQEFPILQTSVNGKPLVYFDNAATSQKPRAVIAAIERYYLHTNSNVHRGVHSLSQLATEQYEASRERIRAFLKARSTKEIIFTRGTTESINLVAQCFSKSILKPGDEIIVSEMEHHSNIVPWQMACEQSGAKLKVIPVLDDGTLDLPAYGELLSEKTKLVAVTHISNALGTVNPIEEMIAMAHAVKVPVLIDGAQAIAHTAVDVSGMDCDFYCFSGHKAYGPTGIGVLYGKEAWLEKLPPWQGGGEMIDIVSFKKTTYNQLPYKFEAGTPNIAGVAGLGAAIAFIEALGYPLIQQIEHDLLDYATERLLAFEGLRIIGTAPEKAAVISFLPGDIHPYDAGTILDKFGIAIRTGHHCAQPIMERFGIPGTIRASFSFYNTRKEIDLMAEALEAVYAMFA